MRKNEILHQELDHLRTLNMSGKLNGFAINTLFLCICSNNLLCLKITSFFTESEENKELRTQLLDTKNQLEDYYSETVEELKLNCNQLEEKCKKLQAELEEVGRTNVFNRLCRYKSFLFFYFFIFLFFWHSKVLKLSTISLKRQERLLMRLPHLLPSKRKWLKSRQLKDNMLHHQMTLVIQLSRNFKKGTLTNDRSALFPICF